MRAVWGLRRRGVAGLLIRDAEAGSRRRSDVRAAVQRAASFVPQGRAVGGHVRGPECLNSRHSVFGQRLARRIDPG